MDIAEEIKRVADEKLVDRSQFVVDVVVSLRGKQKVLIIVDGDQGVTIDDCAEISRELSEVLDKMPVLNDSYLLEVSTPGVDQPLRSKRQYGKHIGRKLKVLWRRDQTVEGKLIDVSEESITLEQESGVGKRKETQLIEIQFSEIDKSFVLVSFK